MGAALHSRDGVSDSSTVTVRAREKVVSTATAIQPTANTRGTASKFEAQAHSNFISFCKAGTRPAPVQTARRALVSADLLSASVDWILLVDSAERKISFPSCIAPTTLRPDLILYSRSSRIVFWMELTVCAEDRFSASNVRKAKRYADLAEQCRANGWQVFQFAVEVGVRGFIPNSLRLALRTLGFSNRKIKSVCGLCSRVAVRSSYIIWLRRGVRCWSEGPLCMLCTHVSV